MRITRREVLAGSGLLVVGACYRGTPGEHQAATMLDSRSELDAKGRNITIRFEGMIAPILTALRHAPSTPVALDVALIDVLAEGDPEITDLHVPTLTVPRILLKGTPTVAPDAVDGHHAYWLIAGRNVEVKSSGSTPLVVNATPLPPGKQEPTSLPDEWSTLAWLADMDALYRTTVMSDWRRAKVVNCIVRVGAGSEIEPRMTGFRDEDKPVGVYRLQRIGNATETRDERVYKHFVRGRVGATSDVTLEVTPRDSRRSGGTITLSADAGTEMHQEIRVSNMPVPWRKQEEKPQPDTRAFGALYGIPRNDRFQSAFVRAFNSGRSDGCECCVPQTGRDTVDADQLPPLKDA